MGKTVTVDVCQPSHVVQQEVLGHEKNGFLVVGQIGGGDLGSCLVLEDATGEDRSDVVSRHEAHNRFVREYWENFEAK